MIVHFLFPKISSGIKQSDGKSEMTFIESIRAPEETNLISWENETDYEENLI